MEKNVASKGGERRALAVLVLCLFLIPALLVGGWILVGNMLAGAAERREDARWGDSRQTMTQLLKELPAYDTNAAALSLEMLSASVGIDIAPKTAGPERRPSRVDRKSFDEIKVALREYIGGQLRFGSDRSDAVPAPLARFLDSCLPKIEALISGLENGEPPRWEFRPSGSIEDPVPNLLGQIEMQRVLLAAALSQIAAGDVQGASRLLDLSWKLSDPLTQRPELICQLIALEVSRMQTGVLRKTTGDLELWRSRYAADDPADAVLRSLEYDAAQQIESARLAMPGVMSDSSLAVRHVVRPLLRPWYRFSMVESSENYREVVAALRDVALCGLDEEECDILCEPSFSSWNTIGKALWVEIPSLVDKVARLQLDRELTLRVLEAKSAIGGAATPARSASCADVSWVTESEGSGAATIRADPSRAPWPSAKGLVLPTSHRILERRGATREKGA